jgi:hypothetical protein
VWKLASAQQLNLSSLFRTYNLALFSNFGDGLIRQSEFRTVVGGNATYIHRLKEYLEFLAGTDYVRDAPRRLNLDHYSSTDPNSMDRFRRVHCGGAARVIHWSVHGLPFRGHANTLTSVVVTATPYLL